MCSVLQVPEFDVVSRSSDSGATVVEGRQQYTDFESLLADIDSTIEADQVVYQDFDNNSVCSQGQEQVPQDMETMAYRYYTPHAFTEDSISMYDDIPTHMIKKEKPDDHQFPGLQTETQPPEYNPEMRFTSEPPQTPVPSDGELEKLRQDVEKTCRELGISPSK